MSAEAIDDRRELAELAFQAVAWAELDQLFGVASTIVPPLEPFASVAPSAPLVAAAPASNLTSFAARASAALAAKPSVAPSSSPVALSGAAASPAGPLAAACVSVEQV